VLTGCKDSELTLVVDYSVLEIKKKSINRRCHKEITQRSQRTEL